MRIDTLARNNAQTQGAERRELLRQQSPQHLEQCRALLLSALRERQPSAAPNVLILGAGACTEIPLAELARASDEVVLLDLDLAAMKRARDELPSTALRKRLRLVQADISGNVSTNLNNIIAVRPWPALAAQGPRAALTAAAACLDQCVVPHPPQLPGVSAGAFGLVISSLVLTQLFSYPLLDMLDAVQRAAPRVLAEQTSRPEDDPARHRRYQEAAQTLRTRIIQAHLALISSLLDAGGAAALLSDIRGFVFNVYGTDHDEQHRRAIPLVPRSFPDMVEHTFTVMQQAHWEWIPDLPQPAQPGRGYEVAGYILCNLAR